MGEVPTPEELKAARAAAGLTQAEAGAVVFSAHRFYWSRLERGETNMDPARWELFKIKTGQHPEFGRIKGD